MKKYLFGLFFIVAMMLMGSENAWAGFFEMGIKRTLTLNDVKDGKKTGNASEAEFYSNNDLISVSPIKGAGAVIAQHKDGTHESKNNLYTATYQSVNFTVPNYCFKSEYQGVALSEYKEDAFWGFSFDIPTGYTLDLSQLEVSMLVSANFTYKVVVEQVNNGTTKTLNTPRSYTILNYEESTKAKFTESLDLWSLTGTIKVKVFYYYKKADGTTSDSKYIAAEKLVLSGQLNNGTKYIIKTSVSPQDAGKVAPISGTEIEEGNSVTLTAKPNTGYTFKNWTDHQGNFISDKATYTIGAVEGDINYVAHFEEFNGVRVSWTMEEGTQAPQSEITNQNIVSNASFSLGTGITDCNHQEGYNDLTYTVGRPTVKVSSRTNGHCFIWTIKLKEGYAFTLTRVKADICRFETSNGKLDVCVSASGVSKELATGIIPIRKNGEGFDKGAQASFDLKELGVIVPEGGEFQLIVYLYNMDPEKYMGFANVEIEGDWLQTYTLNIGSAGYSTFYAAHAVSLPEGLTAYTAELNSDKTVLNLTKLNQDHIPSNTGVVLSGSAGGYSLVPYTGVEVPVAKNALDGVADRKLRTVVEAGDNDVYVLSKQNDVVAFYRYTGDYLPAHKATLLLPKKANAPAVRMVVETTSIENVTSPDFSTETTIYNLRGQRLQSMQAPGLYIVNGKKVLVK